MSELIGCIGCKYADWDADGCTCKISGLLVHDSRKGCEQRKPAVEIKPCPFCGSKNHVKIESKKKHEWRNDFGDSAQYTTFHVRCTVCNARGCTVSGVVGKTVDDGRTVKIYGEDTVLHRYSYYADKAAEAWNRRADNE